MQNKKIKKIVIVGGGSAGWMCAAALSRHLGSQHYSICLVESAQIGTVSVGEATIPSIQEFNAMLGIDENEFLRFTQGSFKLGIEFVDWYQKGESYMHPFGPYGIDMAGIPFHHYWLKDKLQGQAHPLQHYCLEYEAAKQNKFTRPIPQSRSPLAQVRYAFHFDATLYAEFLQNYSCKNGVTRIEGNIDSVKQDANNENITAVVLQDGRQIDGDLFIDCSGFKGLLIAETLKVGFDDWREYLPCDSALAQPTQSMPDMLPYTRSIAHQAGWKWQIPLQHRIGNGLVYASEFMSEAQAEQQLTSMLPSEALDTPRKLQWINGKRKQAWKHNCVAIGLAAGFIEPLESTGIHLIQSGINKLLSLFPSERCLPADVAAFNQYNNQEFEHIRDFVMLHYKATARQDSEFWRYCQQLPISDALQHKIDLYKANGRIFRSSNELFNEISWFSVLNGQGVVPEHYHPMVDLMHEDTRQGHMQSIAGAMQESVKTIPTHTQFIQQHCAARNS